MPEHDNSPLPFLHHILCNLKPRDDGYYKFKESVCAVRDDLRANEQQIFSSTTYEKMQR